MNKFRFLTAGESHGKCLTAIIEGVPAGFEINIDLINKDLKRRQQGYGRGERMNIENDTVEITSGVRFGKTLGSPITLVIQNKDYENWQKIMSVYPEDFTDEKSFTKCRPGHADYAGSIKYNQKDLRNILERSSARKTAIETAVGSFAKQILEKFDIKCSSKILQIGTTSPQPSPNIGEGAVVGEQNANLTNAGEASYKLNETSPLLQQFTAGEGAVVGEQNANLTNAGEASYKLNETSPLLQQFTAGEGAVVGEQNANLTNAGEVKAEIDRIKELGDTIGGKFEVIFEKVPVGLGSYVHWDRMLDGKIAQSVMSIPAVKSVEIGQNPLGFLGSNYHDEMFIQDEKIIHKTNNAGGIEGGMSNGEPIVVRAVMKPISTMKKPLNTVDLATMQEDIAHFERSDTCAVEACCVVAEARIATVLADEILEKFGGDSFEEIMKNFKNNKQKIKFSYF